jgi:hypothetical protein
MKLEVPRFGLVEVEDREGGKYKDRCILEIKADYYRAKGKDGKICM